MTPGVTAGRALLSTQRLYKDAGSTWWDCETAPSKRNTKHRQNVLSVQSMSVLCTTFRSKRLPGNTNAPTEDPCTLSCPSLYSTAPRCTHALKAPGPNRRGSDVAFGRRSVATDRLLLTDELPARRPRGTDGHKWTVGEQTWNCFGGNFLSGSRSFDGSGWLKRPWDISCLFSAAMQVMDAGGLTARSFSDISDCLRYCTLPDLTKL